MKKINVRFGSVAVGMGLLALFGCGGDDSSGALLGIGSGGSSSTGSTSSGNGTSTGSGSSGSDTSSGPGGSGTAAGSGSATTGSGTGTATGSGTSTGAGGAGGSTSPTTTGMTGSGTATGGSSGGQGGSGAGGAGTGTGGSNGGPGSGCPILAPGHDAVCTSPVPLICDYPGHLDQQTIACDQQVCSIFQKYWRCQRQGCPTTMPNPTTPCTPPSGENLPCIYPGTSKDTACYCLSANSWSCQ